MTSIFIDEQLRQSILTPNFDGFGGIWSFKCFRPSCSSKKALPLRDCA